MSDDTSFRAEVRTWLETHCPTEMRGPMAADDHCFGGRRWRFRSTAQRVWLEKMAERGWTAPDWPREYGGGGLSPSQATILREELARLDAHPPLTSLGIWMLGPALLRFGTEAQKRTYLPAIVRGETRWCQGYSEPNAGSDLVSLQTRAERDGDEFVVSGQKIWTSYGHLSDAIFCLVRTDREKARHDGISFLLIDMASPGVSASPIRLLSGDEHFSQVTFEEVRVPLANLVGTLNRGWDVAKYLLLFEREMIGGIRLDNAAPLMDFAAQHLEREAFEDGSALRASIVALDMEWAAFQALVERYRDESLAGRPPGAKSSMLKYLGTELSVKRADMMVSILGMPGLAPHGDEADAVRGWLGSLANRIGGGTSEIQLNVVAKRVLDLPGA